MCIRDRDYAEGVTEKLVEAGVRVVLDDDNQKIGYKIRAAQQVDRVDRKSTRLNSSHSGESRMPSSA